MAVACLMSSGPAVLVQLNPGFWQRLLSRFPSRDGITNVPLSASLPGAGAAVLAWPGSPSEAHRNGLELSADETSALLLP